MNNGTLIRALMLGALATAPLVGCEPRVTDLSQGDPAVREDYRGMDEPTAIGGGPVDTATAMGKIVEARCAREQSCGLIGDKKWASRDACLEVVTREYSDDLTEGDCPDGVDGRQLSECVTATRNADCESALDVVGRVASCRTSRLCPTR